MGRLTLPSSLTLPVATAPASPWGGRVLSAPRRHTTNKEELMSVGSALLRLGAVAACAAAALGIFGVYLYGWRRSLEAAAIRLYRIQKWWEYRESQMERALREHQERKDRKVDLFADWLESTTQHDLPVVPTAPADHIYRVEHVAIEPRYQALREATPAPADPAPIEDAQTVAPAVPERSDEGATENWSPLAETEQAGQSEDLLSLKEQAKADHAFMKSMSDVSDATFSSAIDGVIRQACTINGVFDPVMYSRVLSGAEHTQSMPRVEIDWTGEMEALASDEGCLV